MTIVYAHENAEAVIEKLTPKATDIEIANALAIYMMCGKTPPIVMVINHNASVAPCPLRIDTPGKKSSSVAIRNPAEAKAWAIDALIRGYELSCGTRRGQETRSINGERRKMTHRIQMAEYYAARKANPHLDDDIPF